MSADPLSEDAPRVAVEIVRGDPTPEEVAALVAVVTEAYTQEPDTASAPEETRSRWALSARALRTPLSRERGWAGFTG